MKTASEIVRSAPSGSRVSSYHPVTIAHLQQWALEIYQQALTDAALVVNHFHVGSNDGFATKDGIANDLIMLRDSKKPKDF